MNTQNIATRLHLAEVDHAEAQSIFLEYYGSASHRSLTEIDYGAPDQSALVISITRSGKITKVSPGPALLDAEVDELAAFIKANLIDETPIKIARQIMFAGLPFNGHYRYDDRFQLIPVPPEAPRLEYVIGEHPFLLEVAYRSSPSTSVTMSRVVKATYEIELLCSALLGPGVFPASRRTDFQWVIEKNEPEVTYAYKQVGYGWPGMNLASDEFTETAGIPEIGVQNGQAYYTILGIRPDDEMSIPHHLLAVARYLLFTTLRGARTLFGRMLLVHDCRAYLAYLRVRGVRRVRERG